MPLGTHGTFFCFHKPPRKIINQLIVVSPYFGPINDSEISAHRGVSQTPLDPVRNREWHGVILADTR